MPVENLVEAGSAASESKDDAKDKGAGMSKDTRNDQLGRARVTDNAALNAYYEELAGLETGALRTVANDIEPWEPIPAFSPDYLAVARFAAKGAGCP